MAGCLRMILAEGSQPKFETCMEFWASEFWLNNSIFFQRGRWNSLPSLVASQVISRTWGDLCMPVCPETGEVGVGFFGGQSCRDGSVCLFFFEKSTVARWGFFSIVVYFHRVFLVVL